MKVLIIGSTGFVGKNLVSAITKEKCDIVTCQRSTGTDVRNYNQIHKFIKENKPNIIYNLASHGGSVHYIKDNSADIYNDNIQMCLNLYRAVSDVDKNIKIIQPLSNCSYPGASLTQKEETWLHGPVHNSVFSFGNSKRSMFYISKCYEQQYGIRSVNILFPNAYGPGDSVDPSHTHALNGMIIRMLKAKKEKSKTFSVWGTGAPIREWAYIDDFIKILLLSKDLSGLENPVNMAQQKGHSIFESAHLIKKACNFEGEIVFNSEYSDGDPIKILDDERFQNFFPGFEFYDHYQGILNTVKYYQELI